MRYNMLQNYSIIGKYDKDPSYIIVKEDLFYYAAKNLKMDGTYDELREAYCYSIGSYGIGKVIEDKHMIQLIKNVRTHFYQKDLNQLEADFAEIVHLQELDSYFDNLSLHELYLEAEAYILELTNLQMNELELS